MRRHRLKPLLAALAACGCAHPATTTPPASAPVSLDWPYPPKGPLGAGDIYHVPTGLKLSFDGAMEMISAARLVCIGESHDNIHAHAVELEILRDLERRFPGQVALGMEMFREPQQATLDRWTKGELTEEEFLKESGWKKAWRLDYAYYRAILDFAREKHLDLVALNPSEELQQQVRKTGLDNLPQSVREKLPEIGEPDPFEREMVRAVFGGHLKTQQAFDSFFRVQLLWEENMAERVVAYLKSPRGAGKKMVTLTGGFHVAYGYGLPKKALRRMPMPYAIITPKEIEPPPEGSMSLDVTYPELPLLPADFVWLVRYQNLARSEP